MKKIISTILLLAILFQGTNSQAVLAYTKQERANRMYAKSLKSGVIYKKIKNCDDTLNYKLYDLDNDGIKELITYVTGFDCWNYYIWTYKKNKVSLYLFYNTIYSDVKPEIYYEKSKRRFWDLWADSGLGLFHCKGVVKLQKKGKKLDRGISYEYVPDTSKYDDITGDEKIDYYWCSYKGKHQKKLPYKTGQNIYRHVKKCINLYGKEISVAKLYRKLSGEV